MYQMKGVRVVKVLVGQGGGAAGFKGFWAEFEGEEISSYKDEVHDKTSYTPSTNALHITSTRIVYISPMRAIIKSLSMSCSRILKDLVTRRSMTLRI